MIKILKRLQGKSWIMIVIALVFIVLQVYLDLTMPDYMTDMTNLAESGTGSTSSSMNQVLVDGGYMLLCAVGSLISSIIVAGLAAKVSADFGAHLRELQYRQAMSFSSEEMNHYSTASLVTRSTNDVTQIQFIIAMGLQAFIKAPITAVWAIAKIAGKGLEWTAATGVTVGLLFVMIGLIVAFVIPKFTKIQKLTDELNRVTRENLTGLLVVRAYNADAYQEEKFGKANDDLTKTDLFAQRTMALIAPWMFALLNGLSLAVYWIGAFLISQAAMSDKGTLFSNMVVFSYYGMQIVVAFMMLGMVFIMLPRATVAAKRIEEVIETKPLITDGTISDPTAATGEIEFRHVGFKYPGAADSVLEDISFSINKGETVAFIGSTGSGKSTLINLIPRFYDCTSGEVVIDGNDVKDYKLEALHDKIGYIPQTAVMFSGTVKSNVEFGDNGSEPSDEAMKKAVAIAQGQDFVEAMPEGYEAMVARGGTNLSGGQKQRLAIARAIYWKPEIYIFDDSFSALDYRTDRTLRSALKEQVQGATTLIVAQRIGTIMDADKIVVLEKGKIVGIGKHHELLESCPVYKEIALSQLSQEELA
jgi:ATP-binding cassette subfamily B protein